MTGSNNSLKFDTKHNFIRIQLSEFYLVQKYHIFSIENKKLPFLPRYISQTVTCNDNLFKIITGLNNSQNSDKKFDLYPLSSTYYKNIIFQPYLLVIKILETSLFTVFF